MTVLVMVVKDYDGKGGEREREKKEKLARFENT